MVWDPWLDMPGQAKLGKTRLGPAGQGRGFPDWPDDDFGGARRGKPWRGKARQGKET